MPLRQLLAIALISAACLGAQAQNSSKYLKTLGQEGYTLYFIKPVNFKAGKNQLIPDFTFQYAGTTPESAELKCSLFSRLPVRQMDSLSFHAGGSTLGRASGSQLMFLEKKGKRWHARFSTTLPYSTLMNILDAGGELEIRFHSQEEQLAFPAGKQWRKASAVIKEILKAEIRPGG